MLVNPGRRSKIVLSEYNYRRDIENRLLMADFTVFEVEVLQEVLNNSLHFPIADVVEYVDADEASVVEALDRLSKIQVLSHDGTMVTVDKEMRKYYEYQIEKFDDDFVPDLEYILRGLKRVPIHVLPNWYAISRSSDDIVESIIEKHFVTPKIYRRHLLELSFDDPALHGIIEDVFAADDFKIRSKTLRDKYDLSREQFEEYMLLLEFHFVCFLSYNQVGDEWKEVVTPMHEWRQLLRFQRDSLPAPLSGEGIKEFRDGAEFVFVKDMSALLRVAEQEPLTVQAGLRWPRPAPGVVQAWVPSLGCDGKEDSGYLERLVSRLLMLELAEIQGEQMHVTEQGRRWLQKQPQDQAMLLYRFPLRAEDFVGVNPDFVSERNMREIEKAIRRVVDGRWLDFDAFIKSMIEPVGNAESVFLVRRGRKWAYQTPQYSEEEIQLVYLTVFHRLLEVGMVSIGEDANENPVFRVTPFGRIAIGE